MPSTGTPAAKIASGTCGEPSSSTLAGPPDRMIAFGRSSATAFSAALNGTISE